MKFTIVVPVYNVEKYIYECINSIISQTYSDFEVILIDDGSPDNCPAICDEFSRKDKRIRVIHQKNKGLSVARNVGIDNAKGDYIVFVDSDDIILSDALERFSELLSKNQEILVTELYNTEDVHEAIPKEPLFDFYGEITRQSILRFVFTKKQHVQASVQYIVKRSILIEHEIRFEEGRYHEDNAYTPLLFSYINSAAVYEYPWYIRRMSRAESITNSVNVKRIIDMIELNAKYIDTSYLSRYTKDQKKWVYQTMIDPLVSSFSFYPRLDEHDKQMVRSALAEREGLFKYGKRLKQRVIYALFRIIGVNAAFRLINGVYR